MDVNGLILEELIRKPAMESTNSEGGMSRKIGVGLLDRELRNFILMERDWR